MTHTAYVFPGQGSQSVGMGRALSQAYSIARLTFDEADDILSFRLSELCFAGPAETLTDTRNAQPAILVTSIAALRVWQAEHPELPAPCCLAGHSLGEYTALVASGSLAFSDAVPLTRTRGELMAQAGSSLPGSMAAILRLEDEQVAALCAQAAAATGDVVQVANYNAPGQVVISGGNAGVTAAMELATAAGGRPRLLAVSIASHSALMAPAARGFIEHVNATLFAPPQIPVIGNLSARPLVAPHQIRDELIAQLTSPVRWTDSIEYMAANGATRFVEFGPGTVLTGLVKRIQPDAATANVSGPDDIAFAEGRRGSDAAR
jgi:[acyl-carrier-protein] S-malonyltransferase